MFELLGGLVLGVGVAWCFFNRDKVAAKLRKIADYLEKEKKE